jgi:K+-transporting ATPase KdpC subunit
VSIYNSGPQGFSETFYAYLSQANNNGSAFAGYTGFIQPAAGNIGSHGVTFADLLGGFTMLFARYAPILFALAVAGSLAGKRVSPGGLGTMRTDNATFVVLLIGVIVLVGALTFFPALLLMRRDLLNGFLSMIVLTVLLGLVYPLVVTGVGQVVFPGKANGSLIKRGGVVVGSALIGQQFYEPVLGKNGKQVVVKGVPQTQPDPRYFQTRPSSTSDNAAASAFSNLGPNGKTTLAAFQGYIQAYLALNTAPDGHRYDPAVTSAAQIPVDAASDSASSIDPDISVANARIQAYRIAALRHLSLATVDALIAANTSGRSLGFLGEPGVNVLELNLALDRTAGSK